MLLVLGRISRDCIFFRPIVSLLGQNLSRFHLQKSNNPNYAISSAFFLVWLFSFLMALEPGEREALFIFFFLGSFTCVSAMVFIYFVFPTWCLSSHSICSIYCSVSSSFAYFHYLIPSSSIHVAELPLNYLINKLCPSMNVRSSMLFRTRKKIEYLKKSTFSILYNFSLKLHDSGALDSDSNIVLQTNSGAFKV